MCLFLMSSGFSHEAEKELLIVSCGGGGTHYTAKCLNAAGIAVGHEEVGSYGYVGWPFTVGPYWCTGEFLYKPSFKHTFHQVRHPLNVISSWASISWGAKLNNPVFLFICREIPEIAEEDSLIIQCAKYWYYWNLRAEQIAEWRYKVEDLIKVSGEFEKRLGVYFNEEAILSVPKDEGSWRNWCSKGPYVKETWSSLKEQIPSELYENIQNMAARYGYSVKDELLDLEN